MDRVCGVFFCRVLGIWIFVLFVGCSSCRGGQIAYYLSVGFCVVFILCLSNILCLSYVVSYASVMLHFFVRVNVIWF